MATAEEKFFDNTDPFFNPQATNPPFEETVESFFDGREDFFKKEKDIFDKMKADEAFFFKADEKKKPSRKFTVNSEIVTQGSRYCNCDGLYCGCCSSIKLLGKEKFRGNLFVNLVHL